MKEWREMGRSRDIKLHERCRDVKVLKRGVTAAEHMKPGADWLEEQTGQAGAEHKGRTGGVAYAEERLSRAAKKMARVVGTQTVWQGGAVRRQTIQAARTLRKTVWKPKGGGTMVKRAGAGTRKVAAQTAGAVQTARTAQAAKAAVLSAHRTAYAARGSVAAIMAGGRNVTRAAGTAKGIAAAGKALLRMLLAGGWSVVLIPTIVILLGASVALSVTNEETYTPVSSEVEAYDPLIRIYAGKYGVEDYVELIKAVMMQESGGRGTDPMQASESPYNTRYANIPGGIQDPEYSIEVGIRTLADCIKGAEVESPFDLGRIQLALQGYNFGNGYISWAKEKYGGYSPANAREFSDMMAEKMGWSSYGDKEYVSHVLRYYPYGRVAGMGGSTELVQAALSQVGQKGGEKYWRWYGFQSYQPWCACFVSWCADQCGYIDAGILPKFSHCSAGVEWFRGKGQFMDRNYVPVPGDIIFFDWGNDGSINHAGIVVNVEGGTVHTVEGNSGSMVKKGSWSVGDGRIYGYGKCF